MPLSTLAGQIDAVLGDIGADVVKTGMLPNAEARTARLPRHQHAVLQDPCMQNKRSGWRS